MSATASTTPGDEGPADPPGRRVPAAVWALSLFATAVSVLLALTAFRHGSIDNDDGVYLLQARAIAGGHLTVAMSANPEATQPWFFAITQHGYVSKYLPVVALTYAVGLVLFGSVVPVLAALAFLLPLAVWGLARTAGLSHRRALVATAVVSLSPAVLIQGGLVLSYLPFLVLLVVAWTLLLRVWASGNPWAAGGFGLVAAIAACFRPLDPVLLLGPAAVWVAWRLGRRAVRPVTYAVAAAIPVAVLVLAYDAHTTGKATRLPFGLLSPNDKLGYGVRQLVPEDPRFHFGPLQGLHGAWEHFVAEPAGWMALFVLVLPLALWNLRRGGAADRRVRLLAASAAVFVVGYLAFWGPWNASVLWGGPNTVGPFYAIPVLVPLTLAAASWWPTPALDRRRVWRAVAALGAVALVANGVTLVLAIGRNVTAAERTTTVLHVVDGAPGTLLVDLDPPYLAHPVGAVGDQLPGHGRPLWLASQLSPAQVSSMPDPTLLQVVGGVYGSGGLRYRLVDQVRAAGTAIGLNVTDYATIGTRATLVLSRGGRQQACTFDGAIDLTLTADGIDGCTGTPITGPLAHVVARLPYRLCAASDCLSYSLFRTSVQGAVTATAWRMTRLAVSGRSVTTLTDGTTLAEKGSGWISVAAS
jgi:hypothetical protein